MFIKCSIVILDSPHYYTFYIFNLGVVINLDHCKLTSAVSPLTTVHSLICTIQNHMRTMKYGITPFHSRQFPNVTAHTDDVCNRYRLCPHYR